MMICEKHWAMIRAALKVRCLDHLGAKDGETAIQNVVMQVEGDDVPYDPLMACNWMIMGRALDVGGLYLMGAKPDGSHYCPLCECILNRPDDMPEEDAIKIVENHWIEGPATVALEYCQKHKLVSMKQ